MGVWCGVLMLVVLCVAPALAETWLQWFRSWLEWMWFVPSIPVPTRHYGYHHEIRCRDREDNCGAVQVPLQDSPGTGYYKLRPRPPLRIKDTPSSNALHGSPGKRKRRPWPLLTNAGKTKQQIAKEEKDLEKLLEKMRDVRLSRIRNTRVW